MLILGSKCFLGRLWKENKNGVGVAKGALWNRTGRMLRKCEWRMSQPVWNLNFWPVSVLMQASRASARNSRWLWDPYPKTAPDSHHLRKNISFLVSEYSLVAFFLISPWLFLSPRILCFNSISFSLTVVLKTLNKLCSLQTSAFFQLTGSVFFFKFLIGE